MTRGRGEHHAPALGRSDLIGTVQSRHGRGNSAASVRAGKFQEREGFQHLRAEPDPGGSTSMTVVWRGLDLRTC